MTLDVTTEQFLHNHAQPQLAVRPHRVACEDSRVDDAAVDDLGGVEVVFERVPYEYGVGGDEPTQRRPYLFEITITIIIIIMGYMVQNRVNSSAFHPPTCFTTTPTTPTHQHIYHPATHIHTHSNSVEHTVPPSHPLYVYLFQRTHPHPYTHIYTHTHTHSYTHTLLSPASHHRSPPLPPPPYLF